MESTAHRAAVLGMALFTTACAGMFSQGSESTSDSERSEYVGPITLANNTSEGVCGVEFYRLPTEGAVHSEFEGSITETMENIYRARQMTSTLVNATVISNDFEIERDSYGNIVSRKFRVLTLMRHPESGRCQAQEFGLKQQFDGSGYSEQVQFDGPGLLLAIPCRAME